MIRQEKYIFTGQELINALLENLRGRGISHSGGSVRIKSIDSATKPSDAAMEMYIDKEVSDEKV